jgi:hypothetical protein
MDILEIAKRSQLLYLEEVKNKLSNFETDLKSTTISIDFNQIHNDDYLDNISKDLPLTGKFLYYFSVSSSVSVLKDFEDFININKRENVTKLAKLNLHNKDSVNLYVGSSNCIRKRFKEHCGKAHDRTYAMKLSHWLRNTSADIKFTYVEVNNIDQLTLQHLEDALWREFKPLFGKSGANNK